MPCFKGIAVSVHAEGSPLPEYSVQKQSRVSRVNTYIPVPKAKIQDPKTNKPEPSKFAISITLLTPGLQVPYSQPKATQDNQNPKYQYVAGLPGIGTQPGDHVGTVGPYVPITKSENETIAAYIYFDGRAKEEVATLLRPGEETWVNSRWVQMAEGGGLAEREFLFREVGLERWLNGLDLDGQDAAAKIEKRRQKFEKRRRRRREERGSDEELSNNMSGQKKVAGLGDLLRYAGDDQSPIERLSDDDGDFSSDSDDDAPPEAAGQIKVAMFRVLASGEIKRGEYSPQFDANDDDEEGNKNGDAANEADIDHTTSFAKPKTLDPKSISTQTVTGIDGPDKPFAVFTFFYRGERQLQKMGLLGSKQKGNPTPAKRRSTQLDFSNLNPLKTTGTVGFSGFREHAGSRRDKSRKKSNGNTGGVPVEDSEEDDDEAETAEKMDEVDDKDVKTTLSPEDTKYTGELADSVGRIKLKRQHSAEPLNANARRSPGSIGSTSVGATPPADLDIAASNQTLPNKVFGTSLPDDSVVGSPLKKHRASLYDLDADTMQKRLGTGFQSIGGDVVAAAEAAQKPLPPPAASSAMEEEL